MNKFKLGDKVRILDGSKIKDYAGGWSSKAMSNYIGDVRTIIRIFEFPNENITAYMVDYDFPDCFIMWDERGLESVNEDQKIVITTDGKKTTTAALYIGKQRIKEASAKCAPGDMFDFNVGAAIAVGRLTGLVENTVSQMDKFLTGKIALEVPDGKTEKFLKECERKGIRWMSGGRATTWGQLEKRFAIYGGRLTCMSERDSKYIWEIWDDKIIKENKTANKIVDTIRAFANSVEEYFNG